MGYLAFQMLLCLLLAAIIGFIVGWLLRGWTLASSMQQERVAEAESESYPVEDVEGIGPAFGQRLRDVGVSTTHELLDACATADSRSSLASRTELDATALESWAQMADLMRLPGVRSDYSQLLHAAGVSSVQSLRAKNAIELQRSMASVNESRRLAQSVPTSTEVADWVDFAAGLSERLRG